MKEQNEIAATQPPKKRRTSTPKQPAPPKLKLLFTVVNREKADLYVDLLQGFDSNLQLIASANGTANIEMLRYLGLADSQKAVIISIIREDRSAAIMRFLEEKFNTVKNGKGIAYTVPMTGTIGVASYQFLSNNSK
jgi:hypothetical protein